MDGAPAAGIDVARLLTVHHAVPSPPIGIGSALPGLIMSAGVDAPAEPARLDSVHEWAAGSVA